MSLNQIFWLGHTLKWYLIMLLLWNNTCIFMELSKDFTQILGIKTQRPLGINVALQEEWEAKIKGKPSKKSEWGEQQVCCCCCLVASVVSDSVWPHRWQPTRLPRPWDSPGKNTGVGCHFLLQCMKVKMKVKSLSRVQLLVTPWTAAHQGPPSMGFSRQEYWSGVPLPN